MPRLNPGFVIIRTDDGKTVEYCVDVDDGPLGFDTPLMMGGMACEVIASFNEQTLDYSAYQKITGMWRKQAITPDYYPSKDRLVFYKASAPACYPDSSMHPLYIITTGAIYDTINRDDHCEPVLIAEIPWNVWSEAAKARLRQIADEGGFVIRDKTDVTDSL